MIESKSFYFDLAFGVGENILLQDFLNNKALLENGYEYLTEYDYYLKDEMVVDSDEPVFEMDIINREDFVKRKLSKNKQLLFDKLRVELYSYKSEDKINYLNSIFDDLYKSLVKLLQSDFKYQEIINEEITTLIEDLKLQYKDDVIKHKLFTKAKYLSNNYNSTFFGLKSNVKRSFLVDLYDVCIDLFLINDEVVSEEEFLEVFTSSNLDGEVQIKFSGANYPVIYFFIAIEEFFEDFSYKKIEQSKCFVTKQNELLTASNISATKSRNKNSSSPLLSKIDFAINELKKKYLS